MKYFFPCIFLLGSCRAKSQVSGKKSFFYDFKNYNNIINTILSNTVVSYQFFKNVSIFINHGLLYFLEKTFSITLLFPILIANFSMAEIVKTIC